MAVHSSFPVILLAAGFSRRMGSPKGLLSLDGDPWFIHQIKTIEHVGLSSCILVLGEHARIYTEHPQFASITQNLHLSISIVVNPHPERGPFSSIHCAIQHLIKEETSAEGVFIHPLDTPCSTSRLWNSLAQHMLDHPHMKCGLITHKEKGGHPVILSRPFMESLLSISPDEVDGRLDRQIQKLPPAEKHILQVDDPFVCLNMNTPSDWEYFLKHRQTITRGITPHAST